MDFSREPPSNYCQRQATHEGLHDAQEFSITLSVLAILAQPDIGGVAHDLTRHGERAVEELDRLAPIAAKQSR